MNDTSAPRCPMLPPAVTSEHRYAMSPGLTRLQAQAPVVRVTCPTGPEAWLVSRHAEVREVLDSSDVFSSSSGSAAHRSAAFGWDTPIAEGDFSRLDGADFLRIRRALAPELSSPRRLAALRPRLKEELDRLLDGLPHQAADLHEEVCRPLGQAVFARLFDLPEDVVPLVEEMIDASLSTLSTDDDLAETGAPVFLRLLDLVEERRAAPGDDVLSRLVVHAERAEPPLSDSEITVLTIAVLSGGYRTLPAIASYGLLALFEDPRQLALLSERPELCDHAVHEITRFIAGGADGVTRRATRDTELGGQTIGAGEYVVVSLSGANRDPRFLADADTFDVTRPTATTHLGFGHGLHRCVGEPIARMALGLLLETLARRLPSLRLAVPAEEIPFQADSLLLGPTSLPVTWDAVLPA
ncbi:cytochrome P450 [Streptomyces sp. NPDC047002]|uniref:cytochrome P450 n=1 Tax=Streptomyces sp. NPDC047002 TaxID=3155475 RepID=UPI0034515C0E